MAGRIFVLLPIYNEEPALRQLVQDIKSVMDKMGRDWLIIACNDGSKDNSGQILKELSQKYPMDIITHNMNRGLWETIRDLFERAAELSENGDIVVRMDADYTHDPKYIPEMVRKIEQEGYDLVIASRFEKGGGQVGLDPYRSFVSYMAQIFARIVFGMWNVKEISSAYRAYKAELVKKAISFFGNDFIQLRGLGFTCSVEKLVKMKILGAKMSEVGFVLRYDRKKSPSKMITSTTTLGYFILAILYNWPFGGWKTTYKNRLKELERKEIKKRD
ncbi:MAG: glycosyltransferase [bacterium]|nr:glycosyltransferase [bacterium]